MESKRHWRAFCLMLAGGLFVTAMLRFSKGQYEHGTLSLALAIGNAALNWPKGGAK